MTTINHYFMIVFWQKQTGYKLKYVWPSDSFITLGLTHQEKSFYALKSSASPSQLLLQGTCILPVIWNSRNLPYKKECIVGAQLRVKGTSPCPRSTAEQTDLSLLCSGSSLTSPEPCLQTGLQPILLSCGHHGWGPFLFNSGSTLKFQFYSMLLWENIWFTFLIDWRQA